MRVVILTGEGLEHRYVCDVLAEALGDQLLAVVVAHPKPIPVFKKIRSQLNRYSLPQFFSRVYAKLYARFTGQNAHRERRFQDTFYPDGEPEHAWHERLRIVPYHNGKKCLALLQDLDPDIIAVYGTGIIRRGVIESARRGILNMHTGLSPRYRGSDTIFWPIHNEELEWVGVTIHVLDEQVDSGPIIATAKPTIRESDDEDSLFASAVILGAREYAKAIENVYEHGVPSEPQDLSSGTEYHFVDRTVAAERRVRRLISDGLLRKHASEQR